MISSKLRLNRDGYSSGKKQKRQKISLALQTLVEILIPVPLIPQSRDEAVRHPSVVLVFLLEPE